MNLTLSRSSESLVFFLCLLLFAAGCTKGSNGGSGGGAPTFSKSYGSSRGDMATDGIGTPDGGYAFVGAFRGRSLGSSPVDEDLWVTKLDALGDLEWSAVYRENQTEVDFSGTHAVFDLATERVGGGFFLTGVTDTLVESDPGGNSPTDLVVTRLGNDGATIWSTEVEVTSLPSATLVSPEEGTNEDPRAALAMQSGGLVVGGLATASAKLNGSSSAPLTAPFVARLDTFGEVLWQRELTEDLYGIPSYANDGMHLLEVANDGVLVVVPSYRSVTNAGEQQDTAVSTRLTRLDANGQTLWTRRFENIAIRGIQRYLRPEASGAEAFVAVGSFDALLTNERPQLWTFDANGQSTNTLELPDLDVAYEVATHTDSVSGVRGFCVAGLSNFGSDSDYVRVERFSSDVMDTVTLVGATDLVDTTAHVRLRSFDDGLEQGFEVLVGRLRIAELLIGDMQRVRFALDGTNLSSAIYPIDFPALIDWNGLEGRRQAGWFDDGSEDYWAWRPDPFVIESPKRILERRNFAGELVFERVFEPLLDSRVERALQVALVEDSHNPDNWQLAVLGEVAWSIDQNPPPEGEPLSAWLLRLSSDGAVLSQTVFDEFRISDTSFAGKYCLAEQPDLRRSQASMDLASNGDAYLIGELDGVTRVLRVAADGNIIWSSEPLAGPTDRPGIGVEALQGGGVIAYGHHWLGRLDNSGNLLWQIEPSLLCLGGVCQMESGKLLLSGVGQGGLKLACLDLNGSLLWGRSVDREGAAAHDVVQAVVPMPGGGATVAGGRHSVDARFAPYVFYTWDVRMLRVEEDGDVRWSNTYGAFEEEALGSLSVQADGGLLLSGRSDSLGERSEAWLVRTDSCGLVNLGCNALQTRNDPAGLSGDLALELMPFVPNLSFTSSLPGVITSAPTLATVQSVTTDVVVARQCSGSSKDAPADQTSFNLTVIIQSGQGTVTEIAPAGLLPRINCPTVCSTLISAGDVVELSGLPAADFSDPIWNGGDCDTTPSSSCTVTMDANKTVRVVFPEEDYVGLFDLTVDFVGSGSGRVFVDPPGLNCTEDHLLNDLAAPGDSYLLTATADPGSSFGGWGGASSVDGNQALVTFGASDRTVTVRFD